MYRGEQMLDVNMLYRIDITREFCILWDILWRHLVAASCGAYYGYHTVLAMHDFIISGSLHWCHGGSYYVY